MSGKLQSANICSSILLPLSRLGRQMWAGLPRPKSQQGAVRLRPHLEGMSGRPRGVVQVLAQRPHVALPPQPPRALDHRHLGRAACAVATTGVAKTVVWAFNISAAAR